MHRRTLLAGAALLAATSLAACATGTPTPAAVASDVNLIATAFAAMLPTLASIPGINASTTASVNQAIGDLQVAATAIVSAATTAAAQPVVSRVETDVNAVIAVLAGLPLPAPIPAVLEAASVLLPIIETAVGMTTLVGITPATMTPTQARAALRIVATQISK
ncbi:MAG: hypothetical protein WBQ75_02310 [Acetobacteraceae bacterium]